MTQTRRTMQQLERIEDRAVIPPSLAEAFAEIEQLDARHPESRGSTYAAIRQHESRCHRARMTQDGR